MFCESCGNKIQDGQKFCTECGNSNVREDTKNPNKQPDAISVDKWWQRLLKVAYIFLYVPLLIVVPAVWSANSTSYSYYGGQSHYDDTTGEAFWYSLLALVIYIVVARLVKITVLYIAMGRKPQWKKEFKKLY